MRQEIEQYLRIYVNLDESDWAGWLGLAEFSHNDKVSASTSVTPFFANTGRHPWKGHEGKADHRNESAHEFADRMKKVRNETTTALEKAQAKMKRNYDKHRKPAPEFKVGDRVYVEATNLETNRPSRKLSDKRLGPYEIVDKVGSSSYRVRLPGNTRKYNVFNEALLTPYHEPPTHRRDERPAPEIIDDAEEHEVESILDSRRRGRGYQFLIKWKGFPTSENTWEPERNLTNCSELLEDFKRDKGILTRAIYVPPPLLPAGYWDEDCNRYVQK